jgi:hypothetical protein
MIKVLLQVQTYQSRPEETCPTAPRTHMAHSNANHARAYVTATQKISLSGQQIKISITTTTCWVCVFSFIARFILITAH